VLHTAMQRASGSWSAKCVRAHFQCWSNQI